MQAILKKTVEKANMSHDAAALPTGSKDIKVHARACVCACDMWARPRVRVHACIGVCARARTHARARKHVCVCCVGLRLRVLLHGWLVACERVPVCLCACARASTCACACVRVYAPARVSMVQRLLLQEFLAKREGKITALLDGYAKQFEAANGKKPRK